MIDKEKLTEIIKDFEMMQDVIAKHLSVLRAAVGLAPSVKNDFAQKIEKKRANMVSQMEKIRAETLAQVNMSKIKNDFPMPDINTDVYPVFHKMPDSLPEIKKKFTNLEEKNGKKE